MQTRVAFLAPALEGQKNVDKGGENRMILLFEPTAQLSMEPETSTSKNCHVLLLLLLIPPEKIFLKKYKATNMAHIQERRPFH